MQIPDHAIFRLLCDLGVVDAGSIKLYASRVRDREDIAVYRCEKSGVILLNKIDQAQITYYADKNVRSETLTCENQEIPFAHLDNARRQAEAFGRLIKDCRWMDFGCGNGALLKEMAPLAAEAWGIEPNDIHRAEGIANGLQIVAGLNDLPDGGFDVISLFHVFEHLPDPVKMATTLKSLLRPGGLLLVEVPHARDFLLETLDCDSFRRFTLWSEHLVLHTRESLAAVLGKVGFSSIEVNGYQRFPLSNHLYWLRHGKPGGHEQWWFIDTPELSSAYRNALENNDQTDTIIAMARV